MDEKEKFYLAQEGGRQMVEFMAKAKETAKWLVDNNKKGDLFAFEVVDTKSGEWAMNGNVRFVVFPGDRGRRERLFDGFQREYPLVNPRFFKETLEDLVSDELREREIENGAKRLNRYDNFMGAFEIAFVALTIAMCISAVVVLSILFAKGII